MARNRITIDAPPEAVFDVLSDGSSYDDFVVGTKRIRSSDAAWPQPGSTFHHTMGVGPLQLNDFSRVLEADPPRRLVLQVRGLPLGVARVAFTVEPHGAGSSVTLEEHGEGGPLVVLAGRLLDVALVVRNAETLRRFKRLVERRAAPEPG